MNDTRKFVLIEEADAGMFCLGIFKDYRTAIGEVMERVWEFKESYQNEGDVFEYSEFEGIEDGAMMTVKFKAACWKKECEERYYILRAEKEDE